MAGNSEENQLRFGISNSFHYWDEVIKHNVMDYKRMPTARTAFNLANSMWSVIEWIKNDPKYELKNEKMEVIRKRFEAQCPALSVMHDLCTHGKHYTIGRPRSDSTINSDTKTGINLIAGGPGLMIEPLTDFTVVSMDGEQVPLNDKFQEVIDFWLHFFEAKK